MRQEIPLYLSIPTSTWREKRKELSRKCPIHPDSELVQLDGSNLFSQLDDESLFVGHSAKTPELLTVDAR